MPDTRVTPHYPNARQGSVGRGNMAAGKNIDVGGIRPLVSRTEINCVRPGVSSRSGKPAYKSQEEQYQEIQELRQGLGHLREENSTLRTKSRRLEEDLARRDRQIQQLMDPTKNDEARRKLTDKGASLVASLKLRVSRLEATLRAKEAELARLHASAKATSLNEMKIEAETYYQEVVRLRNQLNIIQQQQNQYFPVTQPPPPPPHTSPQATAPTQATGPTQAAGPTQATASMIRGKREGRERGERREERGEDRRRGGDGQESPSAGLRQAVSVLEEENVRLSQQASALVAEKEKLTADLERVLGLTEEVKGHFEGLSRAELIREVERREAEVVRWEAQHRQLTDALGRHSEQAGESSALLQARVAELQGREEEWKRERSSLQELINTLKDDRIFYKETAQRKDSELAGLRQEVHTLQQEVLGLQGGQRRRGDRLPSATQRSTRPGTASASTASRSASSSEAQTPPSRRPRPSSARPPVVGTRPQRVVKASSEPRETVSPSRRTPSQSRKPPNAKSSRTTSSSIPSSSQTSPRKQVAGQGAGRGVIRQSRQPTPSSSMSSKTSTPMTSPIKLPTRVTSSSSSSPQHRSNLSSPLHRNGTARSSKHQNGVIGSPQSRESTTTSPKHRNGIMGSPRVKPTTPVKTPTPRSSSRSSTPSSQVRSSPSKVPASPRSPSKVPQPSPRGRKGGGVEAHPPHPPQQTPRRKGSSGLSSAEEDERVLAEIIFQRDTDSSLEVLPDTPRSSSMTRQHTVTLDTQEEEEEVKEEEESQSRTKEGEEVKEDKDVSPGKKTRRKDREIGESLDVLRSLLTGHLSRQQEVNHLLTTAPLLVGEGQGESSTGPASPQVRKSPRQTPEGAETGGRTLVRQGTFNVEEEGEEGEEETPTALHATLDAHLTRTKGVKQLK